jgi:hypothetical protein
MMVEVEVLIPYAVGHLLDEVHRMGSVLQEDFTDKGNSIG